MRNGSPSSSNRRVAQLRRSGESGYAMLLALAMIVMMIVASTVAMTNLRTQGQRMRERETVWRGKQYVAAIKRFYRRSGRYPQNLDELEKGVANIHFLRQEALKDPMNTDEDGKWRFIYTNASGQIIGSVHYATMQQMAILDLNGGKIPSTQASGSDAVGSDNGNSAMGPSSDQGSSTANCPPAPNSNQFGTSQSGFGLGGLGSGASGSGSRVGSGVMGMTSTGGAFAGQSAVPQFGSSGTQDQTGSENSTTCPQGMQLAGAMGMQPAALQALLDMKPTGPVDSPVIGGFLIGVASTVDRKSVRIYKGGKKYSDWEFIWNPLEEQALAMQQAMGQSGGLGGVLGGAMGGIQPNNGVGTPGTGAPGGMTGGPGLGPLQTPPTNQAQPPQTQQQ
jgi:type II secretory pathway pseudopilin PulG